MKLDNVFQSLPADLSQEHFDTLFDKPGCKIERIVSYGQVTPEGECYDQEQDEFVLILQGAATIDYLDTKQTFSLQPGDHLLIPAGVRHRVSWTDPVSATIWLAVFC